MRCCTKSDFAETYCFGHNSCNFGLFLFKIGSKCAHFWEVSRGQPVASATGCNRSQTVWLRHFESRQLQLAVQSETVLNGLVMRLHEPDSQTLMVMVFVVSTASHWLCSMSKTWTVAITISSRWTLYPPLASSVWKSSCEWDFKKTGNWTGPQPIRTVKGQLVATGLWLHNNICKNPCKNGPKTMVLQVFYMYFWNFLRCVALFYHVL